ncbi:MAG TPA: glycoside-pentoside-hexuronide (GPH):cation symporter [Clostridia bacterium]|nr:glycoside-pentoside-hexuronide (GPH):cation symporter [Clostridia bacterium]
MNETAIPKLKLTEKLGFGAFSLGSNIVYQFKSLYYLFFLTNVLMIDVAVAGAILALGTVWDAINDPLVGYYAVNHRFRNKESVRPFALWYAVPWAVTTVLLFTNFNLGLKATVVVAALAYFLFELFNTAVGIPYNSMGCLATNLDADRRSINVMRNLGGCVGMGIGAVACLPLLRLFGALNEEGNLYDTAISSRGFFYVSLIMGALCIFGCFVHYFTTKERVKPQQEEERISILKTFKSLYSYRPFLMNTLYIICYGIILLLVMTCLVYYSTYILGSSAAATPIMAAYLVASVASSFLLSPIDKKLGRKKTMLLGGVFFVLGKIWFILNPYSIIGIYISAITTGIAVTITFVMFNTNRNNLSDLVEWRSGRRLDGMIGTADNLASKLGEAGAAWLIGVGLKRFGFDANLAAQPESALRCINFLLGWAPAIVGVLLMVVVYFLNIDEEAALMHKAKAEAN